VPADVHPVSGVAHGLTDAADARIFFQNGDFVVLRLRKQLVCRGQSRGTRADDDHMRLQ